MKLSYIQWYLLLWATLVTFMLPPKNNWVRGLILLGVIMTFWTAPVALILLPIWLLKLIYLKSWKEKSVAGFILAMGIFSYISISAIEPVSHMSTLLLLGDLSTIKALVVSIFSKIISSSLLGPYLTYEILTFGWQWFYLTSITLALGLLVMFVKNTPRLLLNVLLLFISPWLLYCPLL